jgi:Tfp pilus assembly protein PilF
MLNSRNVHFAVLGIILGAAVAYVYASYQTEAGRRARAALLAPTPADHPDVTDAEVLALFEEAVAANPNDADLLTRYGSYLFDLGRYDDAAAMFQRLLDTAPEDADIRTFMATSLFASGRRAAAMDEFTRALESDPSHILALHNLALGHIDFTRDYGAAETAIARIETLDPNYVGLSSLRSRLRAARAAN